MALCENWDESYSYLIAAKMQKAETETRFCFLPFKILASAARIVYSDSI